MAGSLIKIDEEIVSSAVASVTLGGADWDSSYDVYMVRFNNMKPDTDSVSLNARLTVSGSPDTSSNYDRAMKELRSDGAFNNYSGTNQSGMFLDSTGTGTGEQINGVAYLFNFNNASEYSFLTFENTVLDAGGNNRGRQGGFVLTVAQATDGIQFYFGSGNIAGGTFTLYGLKK
tara:strand:- start:26 stop:547 length:522 start_codon:yes stop_codon:yes gene_type:complete